jgi:hypothetical protein
MIEEKIRLKIRDLVQRGTTLTAHGSGSGHARDTYHLSLCEGWLVEALNVIELAIPSPNNAYRRRVHDIGEGPAGGGTVQRVGSIVEILRALLPDIDEGLLANLRNAVTAEAFDDFLDHAKWYWQQNRKNESGVIAGVVFEDTIRRIYRDKIADDGKVRKLEDLINTLAKNGVITGQQSKQAKVASDVRTKATHAQWDEINFEAVESTIQITRLFLREHLGG